MNEIAGAQEVDIVRSGIEEMLSNAIRSALETE